MLSVIMKQVLGAAFNAALKFYAQWQARQDQIAKGRDMQRIQELKNVVELMGRMEAVERVSRDDLVSRLRNSGGL